MNGNCQHLLYEKTHYLSVSIARGREVKRLQLLSRYTDLRELMNNCYKVRGTSILT